MSDRARDRIRAEESVPPIVVADKLTKRYGRRMAVSDVSFEVGTGEVLGLLGPNGSGKTTILRMLTGFLHPSSGSARIAGFDVVDDGLEARRRIGYVPEETPLYPHMRVEEFLAFMARLKGMSARDAARALETVCARLSLGDVRRLTIDKLSRGFRQRVAIAQALLNDPALLVLDEPATGLDPRQINDVRELIRSLAAHHTVVVTSHILSEIEHVATRVAVLLDGRLRAVRSLGDDARPTIRLRVRSASAERIESVLTGVPGVTAIARRGPCVNDVHDLVVEADAAEITEHLAAAVTAAGLGLIEMTEMRPDLEALYLELTS